MVYANLKKKIEKFLRTLLRGIAHHDENNDEKTSINQNRVNRFSKMSDRAI